MLKAVPDAWMYCELANHVLEDVTLFDSLIEACDEAISGSVAHPRLLFADTLPVEHTLSADAHARVCRVPYRLDLADLDEADFLCRQVVALVEETGQADLSLAVRTDSALAMTALWRHRVFGDLERLRQGLESAKRAASSGDVRATALRAECQMELGRALADLGLLRGAEAQLEDLLNPDTPIPHMPVLPWWEARWASVAAHASLACYELSQEFEALRRALDLATLAMNRADPAPLESEEVYLAVLVSCYKAQQAGKFQALLPGLTRADIDAQAERTLRSAERGYWYAIQAALRHAAWSAGEGWNQAAENSARFAYDILDQVILIQTTESDRQALLRWLATATRLVVAALSHSGAPGPAAARLEQSRARLLASRFPADEALLSALPDNMAELRSSIADNLATLRNPFASRRALQIARHALQFHLDKVHEHPGFEFFMWRFEPESLLSLAGSNSIIYLTPGNPAGVAILGGGQLGGWKSVDLPGCGADVPDAVHRFHGVALNADAPIGRRRRAVSDIVDWLSGAVWAPLETALGHVTEAVWLVPCGYLTDLPCHAARMPNGAIAVNRFDLRYAVSVQSLAAAQKHPRSANGELRFVGIPEPVSTNRLQGASAELAMAAAHFEIADQVLAGNATPEHALRVLRHSTYAHAACHGVADHSRPQFSGLILEGGRLTIDALSGLNNALELAVLSACETHLTAGDAHDDVFSLAAAVHLSGSRGVIGSSWRVPDQATAALMKRFYYYWRVDSMTPPNALRQAQLEVQESPRWREPYYWGGFSFIGTTSS